jgi:hypothetical protein
LRTKANGLLQPSFEMGHGVLDLARGANSRN